jgi:alkylhydroperoxidase family enzyme
VLLPEPEPTAEAKALFDDDVEELGFVMNASKLWAYQPSSLEGLFALASRVLAGQGLSFRDRGIIVLACASTIRDSACSVAWGHKLASVADADTIVGVLRGDDSGLTDRERALAEWTRKVVRDANATTAADVEAVRSAGWTDEQIFAVTVYAGLRLAFATVNDALGVHPDAGYRTLLPAEVLDVVTYGRPLDA